MSYDRSQKRKLLTAAGLIAAIVFGVWGFKVSSIEAPVGPTDSSSPASAPNASEGIWELRANSIDLEELQKEGVPIVIDFGSDECVPCKEMAPVLEKANDTGRGKVLVKFVDVWENPSAALGFPVQVIPTQVFFDADGNPYVPSQEFTEEIGVEFLAYKNESGAHVFTAHQGALSNDQLDSILKDMGA